MAQRDIEPGKKFEEFLCAYVRIGRPPLTTDYKNPNTGRYFTAPSFWQVGRNPSSGSEGDLYYLSDITANEATWRMVASGEAPGGTVTALVTDDAETVAPDGSGNINIDGVVVANAANAKPLYTDGTVGSSLVEIEIQVGAAITGAPADKNDAGIVSFDDTHFAVDSNGYVTAGGGVVPLTFAADTGTAQAIASVITFTGGAGLTSSATGGAVTFALDGSNSITWEVVTDATKAMAVGYGYIGNRGTAITYTLPATAAVGDTIKMTNIGDGLPVITANTGQTLLVVDTATSVAGTLTALDKYCSIEMVCSVANTTWSTLGITGNWTEA